MCVKKHFFEWKSLKSAKTVYFKISRWLKTLFRDQSRIWNSWKWDFNTEIAFKFSNKVYLIRKRTRKPNNLNNSEVSLFPSSKLWPGKILFFETMVTEIEKHEAKPQGNFPVGSNRIKTQMLFSKIEFLAHRRKNFRSNFSELRTNLLKTKT